MTMTTSVGGSFGLRAQSATLAPGHQRGAQARLQVCEKYKRRSNEQRPRTTYMVNLNSAVAYRRGEVQHRVAAPLLRLRFELAVLFTESQCAAFIVACAVCLLLQRLKD